MAQIKFDPSKDGFMKFMDPVEETVLRSLWLIGTVGATRERILKEISSTFKNIEVNERGVIQALRKLRAKGLIESRVERMSPPITVYRATMNEKEAKYYLVSSMCSILKTAMPEEYEEAKRKLGLTG